MKKTLLIALIILMIISSTSCGKSDPVADEEGGMLRLTAEEIEKSKREGFFILNEDKTYSPVMNTAQGYQGEIPQDDETIPSRFLWYTENQMNITQLIPTVTKDTPLVEIFNTNAAMPKFYSIEEYQYRGYTVGMHFFREENNMVYLTTENSLAGSDAAYQLSKTIEKEKVFNIKEINENKTLPLNNIDNNIGLLLGLDYGKYYTFKIQQGTRFKTLKVVADTQIFQSKRVIGLTTPYRETEDGHFAINLPENLTEGYYYICGVGMFFYKEGGE